ncbi:alcaligin biosynthesis protein [Flavobacterium sp. WLB]|uniref:lysine N(6)-hydroxylase/L-ornithine N(5)-oxygenase family protein n=1 Tax=unclassified Flavobacterium TaxID=196869 RepID=UPI0006ABACA5|nr:MULTISPECIES: lysine N(6)-hydroxylase/L-ornithine N(5)-oxygenase family protein [unclassified Flavobacterium]KOP37471.1 alcaligin biosynthesis protein [Flavobacterium sp. VMW]OWU92425.1 alcaligin biosynthesis protein [Flavobacterium sp. NLM]PUU69226.1 alcaligin biosynthesis protein [Flavobacterium sp. WLB]
MQNKIYDFIAVGVGPFNLSLACLTAPIENLDGLFFDKNESFNWHPGMLLQDTTLQIPFLADLVTLADPTSPFSFLNYIKEQGKMYSFYIRENFLLLRNEYNQYCQWAIKKLPNIHFNTEVTRIEYDENQQLYIVSTLSTKTNETTIYKTKKIVLGTGTAPHIPKSCQSLKGKAIHSSAYIQNKASLQKQKSITVLGSGQSAAEVFNDLLQEIDVYGYQLNWITRSSRFFPMDYSKLTLEMTSPEYVDYFYNLPSDKRDHLLKNQKLLYKGINKDLIATIFDTIYSKKVIMEIDVNLRTNAACTKGTYDETNQSFELELHQVEQDKRYRHKTDALVLATGYGYKLPQFLEGIANRIQWDDKGRFATNRNYSIDNSGSEVFVQNAELHTHGFVTPDLGMACYRNSYIIKEITGVEHYAVETKIAFQEFGVPAAEVIESPAFETIV